MTFKNNGECEMVNDNSFEEKGLSLSDLFFLAKKNVIMILIIIFCFILCGTVYCFEIGRAHV